MKRRTIDFRGKRILVMGLGLHGGGAGTAKFLANLGAEITVTDLRNPKSLRQSIRQLSRYRRIHYVLGRHRRKDFLSQDLIIKNPGVPPSSPFLKLARSHRIPITSDVGIFFNLCPGKIIGITGTRGKSTTAFLIWRFLRAKKGRRVFLGGNIRKSVLEFLPLMKAGDWAVLELSSFQLQDLAQERKSPPIAVLTNIFRDHLNWHGSLAEYLRAKKTVFSYQKKGDYFFANPGDKTVRAMAQSARSRIIWARLPKKFIPLVDEKLGAHYRASVAIALAVAKHFSVPEATVKRILRSFRGLEGREEQIAIMDGVHFINDTTATIPEATMAALKRFREKISKGHKLILICGGSDKKLNFSDLADTIKEKVDITIFLPGNATDKLKKYLSGKRDQALHTAPRMQDAVRLAYGLAERGDYVLLSPGAASFGLFLNEFDRGAQFVSAVHNLRRSSPNSFS